MQESSQISADSAENRQNLRRKLLAWYDKARRPLPWRVAKGQRPDPYHVLVSEAMLQQTQVVTVIPYFRKFIKAVPTLKRLAEIDERTLLRLWQGLGYYARARNLQRAARSVVEQHGGALPRDRAALLALPGVGRYTAGALASIAHDCRAPILDGNVQRVLCRLDAVRGDPREPKITARLWRRAEQILPAKRCGDFNSALMELGALVCTPRQPKCLLCPVSEFCAARALGIQDQIPPPRKRIASPLERRTTWCIRRTVEGQTVWLIEQRPASGRWAGMWQFITRSGGEPPPIALKDVQRGAVITHSLTHRRYEFEVFIGSPDGDRTAPALDSVTRWISLDELDQFPLPRPHTQIAGLLKNQSPEKKRVSSPAKKAGVSKSGTA